MMKSLVVGLVGFAAVGLGQTALAGEYAVSYSNQELTSVSGVEGVHERIVKVARRYCPSYTQIRNAREVQACIADVVSDLVDKVDNPRLTSYHTGDPGVRVAAADLRGETNG
jgi:UrcA family protein